MASRARQIGSAIKKNIRREFRYIKTKKLSYRIVEEAPLRFSTHLPVLVGMASEFKIKRFLELGSGTFSTPSLLNKIVFPDLEHLTSVEDDGKWATTVLESINNDSRCNLELVASVADFVREADLSGFDCVLLDDSKTIPERSATILAISQNKTLRCPVVIHDFEVLSYRRAAASFDSIVECDAWRPVVGIASNGSSPTSIDAIKSICERVKASRNIDSSNIAAWANVFESAGV